MEHPVYWLGVATASVTAYYGNNFVSTDLVPVTGKLAGASGYAMLGLSTASIACSILALVHSWKHRSNYPEKYQKLWVRCGRMYMLFLIFVIILASMTIAMVTNFSSLPITVSGQTISGSYGNAVLGIDYTTLVFAFLSMVFYVYAKSKSSSDKITKASESGFPLNSAFTFSLS